MQVARPSNHVGPVDGDLRLERLLPQAARPAPQVGRAADALLEVVGAADHRRVEADAGHHREALVLEPADVEPPARAAQPDRRPRASMSVGMPRFVANRFAVPAGMTARRASSPGELADAAPDGAVAAPGEDEVGALVERPPHLLRRPLGLGHLVPERILDPLRREHAAQLGQPAVEPLLRVRDDGDLHDATCARLRLRDGAAAPRGRRAAAAAAAARQAKSRTSTAPTPTSTPPATSSGWCMPRYMRDVATNIGSTSATRPGDAAQRAARDGRREQQHEPDVHRDRRGGVARRVARVRRQVLEPLDGGPLARDEQRGHAVGRRLDDEHEHREGGDPPAAQRGADERDERRRGSAARARRRRRSRPPTTSVRNGVRSATIDSIALSSVRPIVADAHQHVGDEQAEQHGHPGQQRRSRRAGRRRRRPRAGAGRGARRSARRGRRAGAQHGHDPAALLLGPAACGSHCDSLRARTGIARSTSFLFPVVPMPLVVLVIAVAARRSGRPRWPRRATRGGAAALRAARAPRLAARLDPEAATGLALTLALVVLVLGGLVLAVLTFVLRGDPNAIGLDASAANWGDRHATGVHARTCWRPSRSSASRRSVAVLAAIARGGRDGAHPQPLGRAVPAPRRRRQRDPDHLDQAPRRPRPARAQPDRRDARAVVPERALVVVGGVLRGRGAAAGARPRAAARASS